MGWTLGFRLQRALAAVGKLRRERGLLRVELTALHQLMDRRDGVIARLEARIAELEARVGRDSRTSDRPPSSEPPWKRRYPKRKPSGKKRGGQRGHRGHHRQMLSAEQVDDIVDRYPGQCRHCGWWFEGELRARGRPWRHQVSDLDERGGRVVTEYRMHRLCCRHCGQQTRAQLPEAVERGALGPRLVGVLGTLTAVCGLSKARAAEFVRTVWKTACSPALVCRSEARLAASLEPAYAEAQAAIEQATFAHADETSWREQHRAGWLWVACGRWVELFRIDPRRNREAAQRLLGRFKGVLGCDRHGAYRYLGRRQLCWAHVVRLFRQWAEHPEAAERELGGALCEQTQTMFKLEQQRAAGELDEPAFQQRLQPVQCALVARLEAARDELGLQPKTRRQCRGLWREQTALWTFVQVQDATPTNNAAERALRHGVLLRKRSHGTQSEIGSRFIERMLSVHGSLARQGRNVFVFVAETMQAIARGDPPPSLVPS